MLRPRGIHLSLHMLAMIFLFFFYISLFYTKIKSLSPIVIRKAAKIAAALASAFGGKNLSNPTNKTFVLT